MKSLFLILGNQLFPEKYLKKHKNSTFFMCESYDLCTFQKHHKLKLILFLSSMRSYADELKKNKLKVNYQTIDSNPLAKNEIKFLDYSKFFNYKDTKIIFDKLHSKSWEEIHLLDKNFYFSKINKKIQNFNFATKYDLVYYDAFGSRAQPELWKEDIFKPIIRSLNNYGVFVTYSSKGDLRRTLVNLGMTVEKIDGPIGKREMIRAIKI